MLRHSMEGERVGVDSSKIVDVDRRHDPSPGGTPAPPGERGREPPPSSSSLLPLDRRRVPPLVHGLHGGGGAGPSEIASSSLFSSVLRSQDLALHGFLNSRRSVTPIALEIFTLFFP